MTRLHRSEWLAELKNAFPELRSDLNSEQGLLSFEMGVFLRFSQKKIAQNDRTAVARCFAIAVKYYEYGNHRLRDAIDTCYVEDLDFQKNEHSEPNWAWELFPQTLRKLYIAFHGE